MAKCKHKRLILMIADNVEFFADSEPYENGREETAEVQEVAVCLLGRYCPKCRKFADIEVETVYRESEGKP